MRDLKGGKGMRNIIKKFKQEIQVYQLVLKDDRTPKPAKWLLKSAIFYAISPIDLIPDFIPLIGHLDDLVIVPTLIFFALRLIPKEVINDARLKVKPQ